MDDETAARARGIALQNALEHGSTSAGIVISKLLGEVPSLRSRAGEIAPAVGKIAAEVNAMPESARRAELESAHAGRLEAPRERESRGPLPPLAGAERGRVVTRFPPEPNGYPHIGHAKAAVINTEYAKMYSGECILRMDDTNPEAERLEYYAAINVGLEWLGLEFARKKNTSDDMRELLSRGRALIESGGAYVCTCKKEDISKGRRAMRACACSARGAADHGERWEKMHSSYRAGTAIVRFRGDMASQNTAMRDPALFRIIDARHPLLGAEHRVWPSYDFAVAVEDSLDGVTHAFRSKEYELRAELYSSLLAAMKMREPQMAVFSRLDFEGMPVSKRELRPLIEGGAVSWYDDPRLPTLEGMRRRGIVPQAIRRFVLSLGFTKADTTAPFGSLEAINRAEIDASCPRLHMVQGAREARIAGLPRSVTLQNHPSGGLGERTVSLGDGTLLLAAGDADGAGALWLIGIGNVSLERDGAGLRGEYVDDDMSSGNAKVQWVARDGAVGITVAVPGPLMVDGRYDEKSLREEAGTVEAAWAALPEGQEVQLVRYGYCRKDAPAQAVRTHG